MTTVWRVVLADDAPKAFTGEGARIYGGRWNHEGIAVVYVCENLALALLEKFVHLGDEGKNLEFVYIKAEIPDNVRVDVIQDKDLPIDWKIYEAPKSTQDLGAAWVQAGTSAVLRVPSVIVPEEFNYILNIAHSDFIKIKRYDLVPFSYDPRIWK